jgi:hypothetical protein
MGARNKLNAASLNGALLVASAIGILAQSWMAFLVTAAIGIGLNLLSGDIRTTGRRRDR